MNVLLIFLLAAIALLALWQAGRRARAGRRTLEEHHRALDTLGQITGHQEQGAAAPVTLGRVRPAAGVATGGDRPERPGGSVTAPARPHVRVVAAATRAGRAPRWSRRLPAPPGTGRPSSRRPAAVPCDSGPRLAQGEAEVDFAPGLSFPSPSLAPVPPPARVPPPPPVGPPSSPPPADSDDTRQLEVAPSPSPNSREGSRPLDGPVGGPVGAKSLGPEPVRRPLAGAPRAPAADPDALDELVVGSSGDAPPAAHPGEEPRGEMNQKRPDAPPGRGRHAAPRNRPPRRRPVAAVAAVVTVLVVAGGAGAAVVLTSRSRSHPVPAAASKAPAVTTAPTTAPPPPPVQLVSSAPGAATYRAATRPVLTLSTTADCWVEARSGSAQGAVVYAGVISAGQSRPMAGPVWLLIGNPRGVTLTINGAPVHPPGLTAGGPFRLLVT
jgi:hypothetical protein